MEDQYTLSYKTRHPDPVRSTQDQYNVSVMGEHIHNMNAGSHAFIADAARINHRQIVGGKVINETSMTERRSEAYDPPDVTKNFSRLPKIHWVPQPNNYGEPVHNELFRKAGTAAMAKGGNKRG
jgi:hypothetical protein